MQMILGDYTFSVETAEYNELVHRLGFRWQKRNRLNRKPALQFNGPDAETLSLPGTIDVRTRRHLEQPEAMKATASKGEALDLLASNDSLKAQYFGPWVIVSLEFRHQDLRDGVPETIQFSIELIEYGEDGQL